MPVPAAYLGIILIWSTTPLTIQWSTQGANFAFAVLARMVIGLATAIVLLLGGRTRFPVHARALSSYVVGGLGLFSSMALTYWSSRHVHSGLISVTFGLSPLMASILATFLLGEKAITPWKVLGMLLGVSGLGIIFLDGTSLGGAHSKAGLTVLLFAVFFYATCLVWLKRIGDDSPPLATTVGSLGVATPLFAVLWLATSGEIPATIPWRSGLAIVYLGVFGSAIAFTMYYYVIKHLRATRIALITLITPVMALLLGNLLNGEHVTPNLGFGTALILLGLAVHQHESIRLPLRSRRLH
ncbi:DMT family transporter [Propionivibrio sp.]|uniref:DMT family transporter n=1 Tax=Propionivibrio sp. TaxID=2212460 RepID=UPI00272E2B21|nr:DMT family transporter [Propionivibrio sp.]